MHESLALFMSISPEASWLGLIADLAFSQFLLVIILMSFVSDCCNIAEIFYFLIIEYDMAVSLLYTDSTNLRNFPSLSIMFNVLIMKEC